MKIQIFTIKDKTESGLNTLINNFIKNNAIDEIIYREDYIALVYGD